MWIFLLLDIFFLPSCNKSPSIPQNESRRVTIFYTNDEHGWMEPFDELAGGASGMMGRWKVNEGYDGSSNFLVLSGGDMWTGPAVSSWFEGESMVEVMNTMGYDAAAVGNHEFDFTVDAIASNLATMDFPLLSANMVEKGTGNIPPFVQPYLIKRSGDIDIGIIGLSSISTPYTAFPANVEQFDFLDYDETIDTYAPVLLDQGVEFLIIIGHICEDEMEALIPVAKKYNVAFVGGGHCHQIVSKVKEGIAMAQAASYLASYVKVVLEYFPVTRETTVVSNEFVINQEGYSDPEIDKIINYWRSQADAELAVKIGYCAETIDQNSVEMQNMVADSWFYSFPEADVSITNSGSIRQDIQQGDITIETVVGLLPFNNTIYALELNGSELIDCIGGYLIGGMTTINGYSLSDGSLIHNDSIYHVLTTDYLYSLSSNKMSEYDPDPYMTAVSYRQPMIDWLRSLNTNTTYPLNTYLDPVPRR